MLWTPFTKKETKIRCLQGGPDSHVLSCTDTLAHQNKITLLNSEKKESRSVKLLQEVTFELCQGKKMIWGTRCFSNSVLAKCHS